MNLNDEFYDACIEGVTSTQYTRVALYRLAGALTYGPEPATIVRVASWLETGKEA